MANGFFQGGFAEGAAGAQTRGLADRTQEADVGLRTRGLELQESQFANTVSQQAQAAMDKQVADTMAVVGQTIKDGLAGGAPPDKIRQLIIPMIQNVAPLAAKAGRNPNALLAQADAQLAAPGPVATAGVTGTAAGTASGNKIVTEREVLERNGLPGGLITDPVKRVEAENKLRDDFTAQSRSFNTVRDYYEGIKSAEPTAAGDLTVIFGFMKLLDPTSNVMPGEQATVQNTTGVADRWRTMYNSLLEGKTRALGTEARADVVKQADKIFQGRATEYDRMTQTYAGLARRSGVDPNNVILDRRSAAGDAIPPPPPGFIRR